MDKVLLGIYFVGLFIYFVYNQSTLKVKTIWTIGRIYVLCFFWPVIGFVNLVKFFAKYPNE